ncbi:bifunctional riboflavin kinase/FAD synthetase [Tepidibacillus infernus]|uniref:Riboflavin biosynthesis protein n=1 Tax=Tepidibacillus decaturensis TaxID=1413211 RepID=A0A135L3I4_9BACI|nr:bifunctional riboflavin kinase/FAD synthetase [Tepidibacillus decaturensis]KXG43429.1 hypothetical protein U473_04930 [Tepidibacillus decaturensis]
MKVLQLSYPLTLDRYQPSVIAIGYFDGVHKGHQQVIKKACQIAKQYDLLCGVMTFFPHPKEVISNDKKIDQITPLEMKLQQFEKMNVDLSYVVHFSKRFSRITPEEFVNEFLVKLNVKGVVVGFDFKFGHMGMGNPETLRNLNQGRFSVDVVHAFQDDIGKISSSRIRDYLLSGQVELANQLLGRNYSFSGRVVHGDKRGRTIGFPTANLQLLEEYLTIRKGVYVVKTQYHGRSYAGVMNIGYKPTFSDDQNLPTYEVYLIDFDGDLYGQVLEIEVIKFLREEKKFNHLNELKKQITYDIEQAKKAMINIMI